MFSCHVCSLFVLRDVIFRLIGVERRESESLIADKHLELTHESERSAEGQALSFMSDLWVYAFVIPQIFLAVLSSRAVGLNDDKAYVFVLVILIGLCLVVEKHSQRLQQYSTTAQDEEAQGHRREEPNLRALPASGRETSLAYVKKLKYRLRTYVYQQDN